MLKASRLPYKSRKVYAYALFSHAAPSQRKLFVPLRDWKMLWLASFSYCRCLYETLQISISSHIQHGSPDSCSTPSEYSKNHKTPGRHRPAGRRCVLLIVCYIPNNSLEKSFKSAQSTISPPTETGRRACLRPAATISIMVLTASVSPKRCTGKLLSSIIDSNSSAADLDMKDTSLKSSADISPVISCLIFLMFERDRTSIPQTSYILMIFIIVRLMC